MKTKRPFVGVFNLDYSSHIIVQAPRWASEPKSCTHTSKQHNNIFHRKQLPFACESYACMNCNKPNTLRGVIYLHSYKKQNEKKNKIAETSNKCLCLNFPRKLKLVQSTQTENIPSAKYSLFILKELYAYVNKSIDSVNIHVYDRLVNRTPTVFVST